MKWTIFFVDTAGKAIKSLKTLAELASEYQVHPSLIMDWKKPLLSSASDVFSSGRKKDAPTQEELTAPLCEEIGCLKMDVKLIQKKL